MTNRIAALLGAGTLCLLLTSCGSGTDAGGADAAPTPSSQAGPTAAPTVVTLDVEQAPSEGGEPLCVKATGTVSPASSGQQVQLVRGGTVLSTVTAQGGAYEVRRCGTGFGPQETFTARVGAVESDPVPVTLLLNLRGVGYH